MNGILVILSLIIVLYIRFYKMNINDIINSIYRLPQTSLDTLIASISEVEYPKRFHLHRENKKGDEVLFHKERNRSGICT